MNEISANSWQTEIENARDLLSERFPKMTCLRCRTDKFLMRIWSDPSLVPGLASPDNNRVIELICENCGFQEKHVVNLLGAKAVEPSSQDG